MIAQDNYYRCILIAVYKYPQAWLNDMTDEDCEHVYDMVANGYC